MSNAMLSTDRQKFGLYLYMYQETLLNMISMQTGKSKSELIREFIDQGIVEFADPPVLGGSSKHVPLSEVQVAGIYERLVEKAKNVRPLDGQFSTTMRQTSLFLPDYLEEMLAKTNGHAELRKGKIIRNAALRAAMEIAREHDDSQFADEINAPALTDFEADEDLARRIYAAVNQWFNEPETKGEEHDEG